MGDLTVGEFENIRQIEEDRDFEIMALQHKKFPTYDIQFHPEYFATEAGKELIKNFLLS